ncbi:hypothetical protein [Streptomyces sp. NPDC002676]
MGRSSYRAGWQRRAFRIIWLAAAGEGAYLVGRHPDTSWQMAQDLWENRDQALAALETGGIGAASALTVGGVTYGLLTRKRRELMRDGSSRCMRRSRCRSGCRSGPTAPLPESRSGSKAPKGAGHRPVGGASTEVGLSSPGRYQDVR